MQCRQRPSTANPDGRSNSWSATTPAGSTCRSSNSNELREKLNVACVTRERLRSSRLKISCHYPIVNYYPLLAASTPRESIGSIVKPGSICPQTGRKNSVVRHTVIRSQIVKLRLALLGDHFPRLQFGDENVAEAVFSALGDFGLQGDEALVEEL